MNYLFSCFGTQKECPACYRCPDQKKCTTETDMRYVSEKIKKGNKHEESINNSTINSNSINRSNYSNSTSNKVGV